MDPRPSAPILTGRKTVSTWWLFAIGVGLAVSAAATIWILGGALAAKYLAVLLLAQLSGLPLGFRLFGRAHAAGWIAGLLFGYAMTAFLCWALVLAWHPPAIVCVLVWAAAVATAWAFARWPASQEGRPVVTLASWTRRDTAALALVLWLVPVLVGPAFANIGAQDADGNRLYRAYFTADFVWHRAVVAELEKHARPPRNPFVASEPIHYYWTYFVVPATLGPLVGAGPELSLEVNAVVTAFLLLSTVYLAAWSVLSAYPFFVGAAVFLTTIAASAEGLAAIIYLLSRGESLGGLRDLNVDAMSRGFGGLRIDDLPRAMWYTPQHSMAYALGLAIVPVVVTAGIGAGPYAIVLTGLLLGASVAFNPLVGAMFCAVYLLLVVADAVRTRATIAGVARHAIATVPVLLALGWIAFNGIANGAESVLHVGGLGPTLTRPLPSFLLSFGPLLLLLAIGVWPEREVPVRLVAAAAIGVVLSVLVMHLVVLTVDVFWVGFRMGHLVFVFAPALVARGLILLSRRHRLAVAAVVTLVLVLGAPTTIIDAYNAQDVTNTRMGPGFHWTLTITPAEQEALAWIRGHTPADAVVQGDAFARGRETWSLIPTWGERRMAGGEPISLMHEDAFDVLSGEIRDMFALPDADVAWQTARRLHIDYVYVGRAERDAYPNVAKFDADARRFLPVFRNGEVTIYAVQR